MRNGKVNTTIENKRSISEEIEWSQLYWFQYVMRTEDKNGKTFDTLRLTVGLGETESLITGM